MSPMIFRYEPSPNSYFIIFGPSKVRVIEGEIYILNKNLKPGEDFLLKASKSLPVQSGSNEKIRLDISADVKDITEIIKELDHNPIPHSWHEASGKLIAAIQNKFTENKNAKFIAVVVGKTRGKTTQTIYHSNRIAQEFENVYVVDGDMGQQSLYMPGTVAIVKLTEPVLSLSDIGFHKAKFTGTIRGDKNVIYIQSLRIAELIKSVINNSVVIVDTDGWIDDYGLVQKINLIDLLNPDFVLVLDTKEPPMFVETIMSHLQKRKTENFLVLDENQYYLPRSVEERRQHRSLMYYKFFSVSVDMKVPRSKINVFKEFYEEKTRSIIRIPVDLDKTIIREGSLCGILDKDNNFICLGYFLGSSRFDILIRLSKVTGKIAAIVIGQSWIEI